MSQLSPSNSRFDLDFSECPSLRELYLRTCFLKRISHFESEQASDTDEFDFFKRVSAQSVFDSSVVSNVISSRVRLFRDLTLLDMERLKAEGRAAQEAHYFVHHRLVVQVVFRFPYHHWDVGHIKNLLEPLVQFDRDVSRLEFLNRGGRFIVFYCPILLQALKVGQCVTGKVKKGLSELFSDASVVVDFFPSTKEVEDSSVGPTKNEEFSTNHPRKELKLNRLRQKKKCLALKLLRERETLPRGSNHVDQRVRMLQVEHNIQPQTVSHHVSSAECVQSVHLNSICPMTRIRNGAPVRLPKLRLDRTHDPVFETSNGVGDLIFKVCGDSLTDFCSTTNGGGSSFSKMRVPYALASNCVQLDESPRDYDLLEEGAQVLRGRKAKEVHSYLNPPDEDVIHEYWLDRRTGLYHRKCALHRTHSAIRLPKEI